jgi:hypothetical protein
MTKALTLSNDMRIGAIGRTRCGKTTIMGALLSDQPRVIVIDSKWRVNWPKFDLTYDPDAALTSDRVIYRHERGEIPPRFWIAAMEKLNEDGGGIIYIDELPEITTPNSAPDGLKTIFRLGGELGVGCWWSAQEATGVNNTMIRQSDVLMLFLNHGASDRDKLIQTTGDIGEVPAYLQPYEFVIFQSGGESYDSENIEVYQYDLENNAAA